MGTSLGAADRSKLKDDEGAGLFLTGVSFEGASNSII